MEPRYILGATVAAEEDHDWEFKEITGVRPADTIKNIADEYAVAFLNRGGGTVLWGVADDGTVRGVSLTRAGCDEVKLKVDARLRTVREVLVDPMSGGMAPLRPVLPTRFQLDCHPVWEEDASPMPIPDLRVVSMTVAAGDRAALYTTVAGEVHVRTNLGKQRLNGLEALQLWDELLRRRDPAASAERLRAAQERLARRWAPKLGTASLSLVFAPSRPDTAILARAFGPDDPQTTLCGLFVPALAAFPLGRYYPDLDGAGGWSRRDLGWVTGRMGVAAERRDTLELEVRPDGSGALFCGRAGEVGPDSGRFMLFETVIAGLVARTCAIAGALYRRAGSGQELFDFDVRVGDLAGREVWCGSARGQHLVVWEGVPFTEDYTGRTIASAEELCREPRGVARRLVGPLVAATTRGAYDPLKVTA